MKHTQGPWKVRFIGEEDDGENDFFVEAKNNNMPELGYGIEILGDDYGDHNGYPRSQRLADAKLIAAAPDLLEACQWAVAFGKNDEVHDKMIIEKLNAAIKKAEG